MKKILMALLLALVLPAQAFALQIKDVLALVAMPLAVAAVSDLAGVPQNQLANLVTSMNQANVPPTQFVQVLRYTPVALVTPNPQQPPLVVYVQQQVADGVTGPALVNAMDQQLSTYGVTPVTIVDVPATTLVVQNDYVPQVVLDQIGLDPLSLIEMPLAVAAVSDLFGVPQDQLGVLAATLNNAYVPPVQFVQVMRYVPVALIAQTPQQPSFVQYVQTQTSQGVTGLALVSAIQQQLPQYGVQPQIALVPAQATPPPSPLVTETYFPPEVRTRIAQTNPYGGPPGQVKKQLGLQTGAEVVGANPHGGPPGQLKKQYGLQTGAEVVHGQKPGRQFGQPGMPMMVPQVAQQPRPHGNPHVAQPRVRSIPPGQARHMERQAPMIQVAPQVQPMPGPARVPPGQAKHGRGAVMAPVQVPQGGPPAAMPPGQAKKAGAAPAGGPAGGPSGQAKQGGGHGHGKD